MKAKLGPKVKYVVLAALGFLCLLGFWSLITYTGLVKSLFLPSPTEVARAMSKLFLEENFLGDIYASFSRVLGGFLVASILAVPLGILVGVSNRLKGLLEPLIAFLRYMPAAAFIPLAILWLGIGDVEKMFIIFIGTFPYLTLLVTDIISSVDKSLIMVGKSFRVSKGTMIKKIIIPASLPSIWDSMRIMAGIGWTYIIVAELVAAQKGIGHVIIEAQRYLLTANIIAGLIVIGILGLSTDFLFKIAHKKFFPYIVKNERHDY